MMEITIPPFLSLLDICPPSYPLRPRRMPYLSTLTHLHYYSLSRVLFVDTFFTGVPSSLAHCLKVVTTTIFVLGHVLLVKKQYSSWCTLIDSG